MTEKKTMGQVFAKEAAEALSDINILYAAIALMEHSLLTSACHDVERRIVAICKAKSGKRLRDYDRAMAKLAR